MLAEKDNRYDYTEEQYLISLLNPLNQARFLAAVNNIVANLTSTDIDTQYVFEHMILMAQIIECLRGSDAKCERFDNFAYLEF